MINYDLPTSLNIAGVDYPITRGGDYRVILDVLSALNDEDMPEQQRIACALIMFYGDVPPDAEEAANAMSAFIDGAEAQQQSAGDAPERTLMDWEHDFRLICAAINRVVGADIRSVSYMHWWSFLAAYGEIPDDCQFSFVVKTRSKMQKGKPLDAGEAEFYRANRQTVDLPQKYSAAEEAFFRDVFGEEMI